MKNWTEILTHLGEERSDYFGAVVPPIIQSSNFAFPTVNSFRNAFENEAAQHLYTRGNNPTTLILRKKLAALEGSEDSMVMGSGAAAIACAIIANVKAGDHIVCVNKPYSWTHKLISQFLPRFDVAYSFVDATNINEIEKAIRPETTVLMLESPNSLTYEIQDLKACAALAKKHQLVTIIDNSYCSPYYQNPIDFGIDIVVHSGSKYLSGHSDIVFGAVCASKKMIAKIIAHEYMTLGPVMSPNDAWLALRGLRTLVTRLEQSSKTAAIVIEWLKQQDAVDYVLYPFDEDFDQYQLAKQQMRGCGGLFSVNFKAESIEKMEAFCNALSNVFLMAVSWGGYESLQIPTCVFYTMSNNEPPPIPYTFVRFYIGLESAEYIIDNFQKAWKHLQ